MQNINLEELKQGLGAEAGEIEAFLAQPDAYAQPDFAAKSKRLAEVKTVLETIANLQKLQHNLAEAESLFADPELGEMARADAETLHAQISQQEAELETLLIPRDPNDDKPVIMEIRAGAGGDEASLFGADLLRMYLRYAERHGYRVEYLSSNLTDMGGVKEVVLSLGGRRGAYSRLKYESGVHRVQRVPETESQGRIHTSAATVAVLPEVDDVQVEMRDCDLRIDTYRASGAGGQHVNKTESAIRITHLPTGIVVQCQDEKSQIKNREQAMRVLKSRLYEHYRAEQDAALASERRSQVGSGDRSERIRTYNFPQGRVTDHRIGLTLYRLEQFLDGDMDELIDALIVADRAAKLGAQGGQT